VILRSNPSFPRSFQPFRIDKPRTAKTSERPLLLPMLLRCLCFNRKMLTKVSRTPANPAYTAAELAFQLKDSGAKALVTQAPFLKLAIEATKIANIPKTRILLIGEEKSNQVKHFVDFIALAKNKPALGRASSSHTDLAYIVYSSGTTGYVLELVSLCRLLACVMDDVISLVVFLMFFDSEIDVMIIWDTYKTLTHSLNHDKQMLSGLCVYLRDIFYFPHEQGEHVSC
jgi:hypothetical protein